MGIYTKRLLMWLFLLLFFSGCNNYTLTPEVTPSVEMPAKFSIQSQQTSTLDPWWYFFNRHELNALIDQSMSANFRVVQSVARLRQAQTLVTQTRSGLYPQINLESNARKVWEGSDAQSGEVAIGSALQWEIDAFNRVSNALLADRLEVQARQEDVNALRLSLSAEIANAYFGAIAAHNTIDLLTQQVKTDLELLELLELRFDLGVGTTVEVLQQQSRVADSQSLIPPAQANLRIFENRLDVLLGQVPDAQYRVSQSEDLEFNHDLPMIGVPIDLLLNRPDLRAARKELLAADADIGAAIADRLPRITLDGSYGYSDSSDFTGPLSVLMGMFVQPLLDWGRRKAEVERNKSIYEEKLALFTQIYLQAVESVENALYQEMRQREFIQRLEKRIRILQETVEESEARYTQGIDNYLPVLNALQELRSVERDLVSERLNLVNQRISLFRAVGGRITHSNDRRT